MPAGPRAADAFSDIDAAIGVDTPCGAADVGGVGAVEAMVATALPELGALADVLRHRSGPVGQWARRIFAQFADSTQLDLAVVAEAQIQARRGGALDFIPLYRAPAPPGPQKPDARMPAADSAPRGELQATYAVTGEQVRERPDLAQLSAQVGCVRLVVQALGTDSFGAGFGQSSPGMVPDCSAAAPVPVAWLSRRPQDRGHHPSGEEL